MNIFSLPKKASKSAERNELYDWWMNDSILRLVAVVAILDESKVYDDGDGRIQCFSQSMNSFRKQNCRESDWRLGKRVQCAQKLCIGNEGARLGMKTWHLSSIGRTKLTKLPSESSQVGVFLSISNLHFKPVVCFRFQSHDDDGQSPEVIWSEGHLLRWRTSGVFSFPRWWRKVNWMSRVFIVIHQTWGLLH